MVKEFAKLGEQEVELMLKAPFLVCILIAGADGTIDKKEIREAIAFTQKSKKSSTMMAPYFKELLQDFEDKLKMLIQAYPHDPDQRADLVTAELRVLNSIWPKLPPAFSGTFYEILKEMAARIAGSSGGLLGIKSVGAEEAKFIDLDMITNPVGKS